MSAILQVSTLADDLAAAMLRSNGQGVFVNGSPAPASTAIFDGDFIETQKQALARIEATGSSVNIDPETILRFQAQEVFLDHGSLSVFTGKGLRVRVGCVTVTPVDPAVETTYEVFDREGKVTVHATKSDVYIDAKSKNAKEVKNHSRSRREIVRESEQRSREETCAAAGDKWHTTPGVGAIMNSPWAIGAGAVAIGGLTVWVLCKGDDPISPSSPTHDGCPIP